MNQTLTKRILVVSDDNNKLEAISFLLKEANYTVLVSNNAVEGFDQAKQKNPDVIVIDIAASYKDGIELCHLVHKHPGLNRTFLLLVINDNKDDEKVMEALNSGADAYLEPPYNPKVLVAKVSRFFERGRVGDTLNQTQAQLASIVSSAMDAIITVDSKQSILLFNTAAEKMFGYSSDEVIGQPLDLLIPERFRLAHSAHIKSFGQTGITTRSMSKAQTVYGLRSTGKEFPLEASISQVEINGNKLYTVILRDVSERTQLLAELKEHSEKLSLSNQQLEKANRLKAEFLANMSHEIRTPMNAIIGLTSLLLDTKLDDQQKEFIEIIRGSGDSLLTIINDILDLSKIESDKIDLELEAIDLRNCVEQAFDLLATKAAEKGLELAYIVDPFVPHTIVTDETRLRQILVNLLSNAIKFTEQGEVLVSVNVKEQVENIYTLHFSVKDTGIGIPIDRQDILFQSFSQVDSSISRKYGGTGLGLAISKRLSELLGGTMWVESKVGQGSDFQFTIKTRLAPSIKRVHIQGTQAQLLGKKVLIVDDNASNRIILTKQTESWGMIPITMDSGKKVMEQLKQPSQISFDIAILDMQMPEMDGVSLAIEMQKIPQLSNLPLILLSSQSQKVASKPEQARFAANLVKPLKQSQLYNILTNIFNKQENKKSSGNFTKPSDVELGVTKKKPLKILLAEDNAVNQKLAMLLLEKVGYSADIAANGLEVLTALKRQSYDLILMDVQMPEMDGLETTKQICQNWPKEKRPYIVAVTAGAMKSDKENCLSVGMDDYITKPIDVWQLYQTLEKCSLMKQTITIHNDKSTENKILEPMALNILRFLQDENNPNVLAELIGQFLLDAEEKIYLIKKAITFDNAKELEFHAHNLKAGGGSLGATQLVKLCAELELLAKKGTTEGAQDLLNALEEEFVYVTKALKMEQENLSIRPYN